MEKNPQLRGTGRYSDIVGPAEASKYFDAVDACMALNLARAYGNTYELELILEDHRLRQQEPITGPDIKPVKVKASKPEKVLKGTGRYSDIVGAAAAEEYFSGVEACWEFNLNRAAESRRRSIPERRGRIPGVRLRLEDYRF